MKFHGIQLTGKFIIQKLSSLPAWTAEDEGRLVYNMSDRKLYLGDDVSWKEAGSGGYGIPVTNFVDNDILEDGKMYLIDTSTGPLTGNLPTSPVAGDCITVVDIASRFHMYNFNINGVTKLVHEDPTLVCDVKDLVLVLIYSGTKWKIDIGGIVYGGGGSTTNIINMNIVEINSDMDAEHGDVIFVDTSTNPVVITLPDGNGLESGTTVSVYDQFNTFSVNECEVVAINGTFDNGTTRIKLVNDGSKARFVWDATSAQWKVEILSIGAGSGGIMGNVVNINNDYDSTAGDFIFVDTTLGPISISLPPSGQLNSNSTVSIFDQMKNFENNAVTVTPAFGTIDGGATYVADKKSTRIDFLWDEETEDWKVDAGGTVEYGTTENTACEGNDPRITTERTRKITLSADPATGGENGDVWMQFE